MDTRGADRLCVKHFSSVEHEGDVKNNRFQGFGRLVLHGNDEYAGMFDLGRMHGLGVMSWSDGLKYVGQWHMNAASGSGSLSWPNGTEYYGDVVKGRRQGSGVLFHGEHTYVGEWHGGKRHGFGTQVSPSVVYSGEWREGRRHGWGTCQFATGNKYSGSWVNDTMEGFGVLTWVTNKQLKTTADVDAVVAKSEVGNKEYVKQLRSCLGNVGACRPGPLGPYTPSCVERSDMFERYLGEFRNNLPHGAGQYEMYFFDGSTRDIPYDTTNQYNGSFADGLREGFGVQKYADGTLFAGHWQANMKHGKGSIVHTDGTRDELDMFNDAPAGGSRPATAKSTEANASIEDALELDDLFLTRADKEAVRELLARFKSSLKHLFLCYAKMWQPEDYAAMVERLAREEDRIPSLVWQSRVPADVVEALPDGTSRLHRNNALVTAMVGRCEAAARDAAQRAMAAVTAATEDHALHARQYTNEAENDDSADNGDDDFGVPQSTSGNASAARVALRKRPATPMGLSGMTRAEVSPPRAAPLSVSRDKCLSHLTKHQLHCLLRDALILDADMDVTAVNEITYSALTHHRDVSASPAPSSIFEAHDAFAADISFRCFVEIIVRIAEAKLTLTATFAAVNATRRLTIADRVEFILDHYLEPLRVTLCELQLSGELDKYDWPTCLADASGDNTLEDLRRAANRMVQREHAKQVASVLQKATLGQSISVKNTLGKSSDGSEGQEFNMPEEVLPPIGHEDFEATVSDCSTYPLCSSTGVQIVTVDVVSNRGTRRSHQLYLLCSEDEGGKKSTQFGGVVPSYHPSVSSVDVYDVLAAIPTRLLHLSSSVKPHVQRNLQFLHSCFVQCASADGCSGTRRTNFGRFVVWLKHRGITNDNAPPTAEGQSRDGPPAEPTVSTELFVRVCCEMEFSSYMSGRGEHCCPSVFLERRSLVTQDIYEDPLVKMQLKVSPEFAEAVAIAVKHTELWDEKRRMFSLPSYHISPTLWWLVAFHKELTFQQFIDVVLRLALQLYGTDDLGHSVRECIRRLQLPEREVDEATLSRAAVPPPPVIDKLLPVARRNRDALVDDKSKKKPTPKK